MRDEYLRGDKSLRRNEAEQLEILQECLDNLDHQVYKRKLTRSKALGKAYQACHAGKCFLATGVDEHNVEDSRFVANYHALNVTLYKCDCKTTSNKKHGIEKASI